MISAGQDLLYTSHDFVLMYSNFALKMTAGILHLKFIYVISIEKYFLIAEFRAAVAWFS